MSDQAKRQEQLECLTTLCDGDAEAATKIVIALQVCSLLPVEKVELVLNHLERAHTLGPIVDPTRYRQALQSNRLDNSIKTYRALLDLLLVLQKVQAEHAEHADPAPAGKDVPA